MRLHQSLQNPAQRSQGQNCQAVVFFFPFVKNKSTDITNMSLPKLISNVMLICAHVYVGAGFRAFHQFVLLLHSMQLCYWGLAGERGVEGKDLNQGKRQHSRQTLTVPLRGKKYLKPELQMNVEGVMVTMPCALRSHFRFQTILLFFPPFPHPLLSFLTV